MHRLTLVSKPEAEVLVLPLSWWFCLTTGREGKNRVIRRERRIHVREQLQGPSRT